MKLQSGNERFSAVLPESDEEDSDIHEDTVLSSADEPETNSDRPLIAPVVGYFRPGKRALEPGAKFSEGEAVGEIVSLGLANEVVAPIDGEIVEIQIHDGDPVEYGQTLATMRSK